MILTPHGGGDPGLGWELCTLGDPLAAYDLLVVYWNRPWGVAPGNYRGFPPIEELIDRYGERSGRDLSRLDFYVAFGAWKLAAIIEGVNARYASGAYGEDARGEAEQMPEAV